MNSGSEYKFYYKRNLPHIQPVNAVFFVTYRLAFTLPKSFYEEFHEKRRYFDQILKHSIDQSLQSNLMLSFNKKLFDFHDQYLGLYSDSRQWLKETEIAQIIYDNFLFWDMKRYDLVCFCIMPNHVHLLIKTLEQNYGKPYPLCNILRSLKGFTGKQANRILKRRGKFWQNESYDHCIRNDKEYFKVIKYILDNPIKARLVHDYTDWKWSYIKPGANDL